LFSSDKLPTSKPIIIQTMSDIINESNIVIANLVSTYSDKFKKALNENSNVYDEKASSILAEASKEVVSSIISEYEKILNSATSLKTKVSDTLSKLNAENKKLIEKYKPMLDVLDTSNISYEISKYSLDKFQIGAMISGIYNTLENNINEETKPNLKDIDEILKKNILGVSPTIDISSFYDTARSMLVDIKSKETKLFSSSIYEELLNATSYLNEEDIYNNLVSAISNKISKIKKMQQELILIKDANTDEYSNNTMVNFCMFKKYVFTSGITIIEDIINLKLNIIGELCSDYRKIIINTYNTVSDGSEKINTSNIYKPEDDYFIEMAYIECVSNRELI